MKKFKTGLLAMALVFGVSAAVVAKVQAMPKANTASYNWTGSGPSGSGATVGDIAHAESFYGCEGEGEPCATGVNQEDPLDVQTIRLPQ